MLTCNSWKAFYASSAVANPPPEHLGRYAQVLPSPLTTRQALENLQASEHCSVMFQSGAGRAKVVHHFKHDKTHPTHPDATNELWALMGGGPQASAVSLSEISFQTIAGVAAPSFAALGNSKSPTEIRALPAGNGNFVGCNAVALPPFLTAIFMNADTDDPATLCMIACAAIKTYDASIPLDADDDEDEDEAAAPTPTAAALWYIPAFLWAMTRGDAIPPIGYDVKTNGPATRWSAHIHDRHLTPIEPSTTGAVDPSRTGGLAEVAAALREQAAATTKAFGKDSTDASSTKKGFRKLSAMAQSMILLASERYADGSKNNTGDDISGQRRSTPIDAYKELIEAASVGIAKQIADGVLNNTLQCPICLPESVVVAIREGLLLWPRADQPGAFSVFSCGPVDPQGVMDATDMMTLQLASTEGQGLSDQQIAKATKICHQVPSSVYELSDFLRNFEGLLQLLFGKSSALCTAIQQWLLHIAQNQLTY